MNMDESLIGRIDKYVNEYECSDFTESELVKLIEEENSLMITISKACPTSFLACC